MVLNLYLNRIKNSNFFQHKYTFLICLKKELPFAWFFIFYKITLQLCIIFLIFSPSFLGAQNENASNSRIDRLHGGTLGFKIKWSGEVFSGMGSRADAMGGSISTLYPGADAISINPAGLGFAHGFHITLDWAPHIGINPGGFLGIEDKYNDKLIEAASKNNPPINSSTGKPNPFAVVDSATVNSELTMGGGLKGGAIMYGNPYFAIAASFHQPLRLETQINVSGIEFLASSLDDQGKETINMFGTVNGNMNLELDIESSSIGFGTRILPNLSAGIVYDHFNGEMNFEGTFLPEGIIASVTGGTRYFNDPERVQYDSLFAVGKGDWDGNGYRFRGGVGYHPFRNISFDAVIALPFTIDLTGPFSMVHNEIRALNLKAEEDEDVIDSDIFLEDNLTKTQKRKTEVSGMDIEVHGSVALGFSAKWANYVASVVYVKYFDQLGYKLSYDQFDSFGVNIKGGDIHQGIDLGSAYRLGIGVEQLILGLGVVFGQTFRKTVIDSREEPEIGKRKRLFLPFFSLGGGVNLGSRFRLDYILSLNNSSFLRFSTSYRL